MTKKVYRKSEMENWETTVAQKFGGLVYLAYTGGIADKDKDLARVTAELIESDVIFSLEEGDEVVGLCGVKLLGGFSRFKKPIYIKEIVVSPSKQGQGISKILRKWVNESVSPDVVFGIANNPISVLSRAKVYDQLGFVTYWGNSVMGVERFKREEKEVDELGRDFVSKVYPKHIEKYKEGIIPYTDYDVWAKRQDTKFKNESVEKVMERILAFQIENDTPAFAVLISVKEQ